ncbi:MAG: hypothetical protein SF182_12910 [Deltaproteobacteria bacterium]|nr:hypothetical protein [Deltaproteobacteria bacterium]
MVFGLALLAAATQAPAGLGGGCCLCTCIGGPQLCIPSGPDPDDCDAICAGQFNGSGPCLGSGFNSSCAQTAECAGLIPNAAAPLVGPLGLTAVAVLLGGFGVWQAARRSRRGQ